MGSVHLSHVHKTNIRDMAMAGVMAGSGPEDTCLVI